ncbi:MAG: HPr family phosphocarrier protein [Rhodospirillaceae bacterium]|nr:HPr family phosphocarrier protein [Rhodospirillaceae bacterium]MBT4486523.1 HPr family phosphocarrier protein [Rhodospirillaceae bacterium]MBT5192771.1 HPr family phosphocarrier protein [Rhodospirillaceae bacterium]MBT5895408.1 HPr family phosphocarrier protein [Rhodospirillaceae bacterium]MBT6428920.1 HPr family phosphocarrier protein [Rhodospirillaceae bacterium]
MSSDTVQRTIPIINRRGLHARAAAKFVNCAELFEAEIYVTRQGVEVPGRSIMGLMMLAAAPGTEIEVRAVGADAAEAVAALEALTASKFDED